MYSSGGLANENSRSTSSYEMRSAGQADFARPRSLYATSTTSEVTGGVGLVFCREPASPYLLVKEVVVDGPAFQSSLIYPGDRLCCINDFDLAWSGNVPRVQQPQLPGPHGSNVTLTFDRNLDAAHSERFAVTLSRSRYFFPDKLTGSSFAPRSSENSPAKSAHGGEPLRTPEALGSKRAVGGPYVASNVFDRPVQHQMEMTTTKSIASSRVSASPSDNQRAAPSPDKRMPEHANSNGWKLENRLPLTSQRMEKIPAISPRTEALEQELILANEQRSQFIQELQSENKRLNENMKALQKDLADCTVQITFLQRQLKIKAEEAASKTNEAAFAEKNSQILKQREMEISDLQAKLSKERVQREAAERRVMLEKDETQKMLAYQQDTKARIENFQEILVRETQERQKVQKKLAEAEIEIQGLESLKNDIKLLREQNAEMAKELLYHRQADRDNKVLQEQNSELSKQALVAKHAESELRFLKEQNAEMAAELVATKQTERESASSLAMLRGEHRQLQARSEELMQDCTMLRQQLERQAEDHARESTGIRQLMERKCEELAQENAGVRQLMDRKCEELAQELASLRQQLLLAKSQKNDRGLESSGQSAAETVRQAEHSIYDVTITTGASPQPPPPPEKERSRPVDRDSAGPSSEWASPNAMNSQTPVRPTAAAPPVASGGSADMYGGGDVELHQSPAALRGDAWRGGGGTDYAYTHSEPLAPGRGGGPVIISAPGSPRARNSTSPPSPGGPLYVSPHRLDDSPSSLFMRQQAPASTEPHNDYMPLPHQRLQEAASPDRRAVDARRGGGGYYPPSGRGGSSAPARRAGIGMSFLLDPATRNYVIKEVHPLGSAGQAAANGDLLVGDLLLAVNGVPSEGRPISDIIDMIAGPEGTEVQITLRRTMNREDYQITLTLLRNRPLAAAGPDSTVSRAAQAQPVYMMEQRPAALSMPMHTGPTLSAHARAPAPRPLERSHPKGERPLPPGWTQELDPSSGRIYFVNHDLKTFCWNRPG